MMDMNVTLMVNDEGRVCLVHDGPLKGLPVCVNYAESDNALKVEFDDGSHEDMGNDIADEIASRLHDVDTVLLVRIEGGRPTEGYEVPLYTNS